MAYPLPPWLQGPTKDLAGDYLGGFHAGAAVAGERARLAAESNNMAMRSALAQEQLQQAMLREQQNIELTKAYHNAQIGLREQELSQQQERIGMATQQAAQKLAARQHYDQLVNSGMDAEEAAIKVGPALFDSAAGFGTLTRGYYQRKAEPFRVKSEVVDGQKVFYMGPNHASFAPAYGQEGTGPIQTREVLDPITKQPMADVFGTPKGQIRNKPVRVDPNLKEIKALESGEYGMFLTGQRPPPTKGKLAEDYKAVKARYDSLKSGSQAAPQAPPGPSPFKEGQTIRNKATGQMFIVKDGKPVLIDESDGDEEE